MSKLLKWDAINFLRQYYWVLLGMMGVLVVAAIPANGSGSVSSVVITLCTLLGGLFFMACLYLAGVQVMNWLRNDSILLELSVPAASWQLVLSKVLVSALINALACLLLMQLFVVFGKYSSGSLSLLSAEQLGDIPLLTLLLTLLDATALFSYLVAKRFTTLRSLAGIITLGLSAIIILLVAVLCLVIMPLTGSLSLPVVNNESILSINGNLNITSTLEITLISLFTLLAEIAGSSLLLARGFQRD